MMEEEEQEEREQEEMINETDMPNVEEESTTVEDTE